MDLLSSWEHAAVARGTFIASLTRTKGISETATKQK